MPSADSLLCSAITFKIKYFLLWHKQGFLRICSKLKAPPSGRDFGGLLLDFFMSFLTVVI